MARLDTRRNALTGLSRVIVERFMVRMTRRWAGYVCFAIWHGRAKGGGSP